MAILQIIADVFNAPVYTQVSKKSLELQIRDLKTPINHVGNLV